MSRFALVRVDDRLLHGQVALGWREAIDPEAFWIADDAVAADPFTASLYEAALPEGTRLRILSLGELPAAVEGSDDLGRAVLLVKGLSQLRVLCQAGFRPEEVNLGGIHHRPGAHRYLDYLFLLEEDLEAARWLLGKGIGLFAQDLPGSRRLSFAPLLARGPQA